MNLQQREWDDAQTKHDQRIATGVIVCRAHLNRELRWCRNPPLLGTDLCISHADDTVAFAVRYGRALGEMAVASDIADARSIRPKATALNRRVEIHRQIERQRMAEAKAKLRALLGPWAGFYQTLRT